MKLKTTLPELRWKCLFCGTIITGDSSCPKCGPYKETVDIEININNNIILRGKLEITWRAHNDIVI